MKTSFRTIFLFALVSFATFATAQIPQETLDSLIATMQSDDYPARQEARMELQDFVSHSSMPGNEAEGAAIEAQLIDLLAQDLPETTQLWLLRQVALIGSEASVDTLAELLDNENPHVSDAARMALEVNPSPRATDVLRYGLANSQSDMQMVGFLNALGQRGDRRAIDAILPYLENDSIRVVDTAAKTLGILGGNEARKALIAFRDTSSGEARICAELALLSLARNPTRLLELAQSGSNRAIRSAAFGQLIDKRRGKAKALFKDVLDGETSPDQIDFLTVAFSSGVPAFERIAIRSLDELDPANQAVAIGGLDSRNTSNRVEEAVISLARGEDEQLRPQAIEALGRIGSIRSLPVMLGAIESRTRGDREAAMEAISRIPDSRVDQQLLKQAENGDEADRITAIKALSYRASEGATELLNQLASDQRASTELREEAIAALEFVGTTDSLPILVNIVVNEPELRRDAQLILKRMTLRIADPDHAWAAFEEGLAQVEEGSDAHLALLAVIDSAPTEGAISYLKSTYESEDEKLQDAILKVLPSWRNWDAGFLLLDLAENEAESSEVKDACFQGVGRLILGSDANFDFDEKFMLAAAALEQAETPEQRSSVINGFRYATWRERVHVTNNEVDTELKEAVLGFAND